MADRNPDRSVPVLVGIGLTAFLFVVSLRRTSLPPPPRWTSPASPWVFHLIRFVGRVGILTDVALHTFVLACSYRSPSRSTTPTSPAPRPLVPPPRRESSSARVLRRRPCRTRRRTSRRCVF